MTSINDIAAAARDAFVLLLGARRIDYRDGDAWELKAGEIEHPLIPRLRHASLYNINNPAADEELGAGDLNEDLVKQLRSERRANDNMRKFLVELEDACRASGMDKDIVGLDVLTWIKGRIATGGGVGTGS